MLNEWPVRMIKIGALDGGYVSVICHGGTWTREWLLTVYLGWNPPVANDLKSPVC